MPLSPKFVDFLNSLKKLLIFSQDNHGLILKICNFTYFVLFITKYIHCKYEKELKILLCRELKILLCRDNYY